MGSTKSTVAQFCIDVTFEMRTVRFTNTFIQLIIVIRSNNLLYIRKEAGERTREGKIAERQRESEGERASVGERQMWRRL